VALLAGGMPKKRIAAALGLDRRDVSTWIVASRFPERQARARRAHTLDHVSEQLRTRMVAGEQNAAQLARELRRQGIVTSDAAVRRYVAVLRRGGVRRHFDNTASGGDRNGDPSADAAADSVRAAARSAPPLTAPSSREIAWLLRDADAAPNRLTPEEVAYVTALREEWPPLAAVRAHVKSFGGMLTARDANARIPGLNAGDSTELRSFAAGMRRDQDAVLAAIRCPWSNGQVEGQVNRLKLVKRTMCGRASFALLRRRLLP
jgi:hypothetical protein